MTRAMLCMLSAIAALVTLLLCGAPGVAVAEEGGVLPLKLHDTPKPNYGAPVPAAVIGHVTMEKDGTTTGVAGVSVTDGYSVVNTDASGRYQITPNASATFVYITRPSGHDVKGSWYKPLASEVDFALEPAVLSEEEYIFINVSDTHTSTDPRSLEGLGEFVREVNTLEPKPRFVVNSGDLINLSKTLSDAPETGDAFFRNYVGIMNNLDMPHYNVAGDHTDSSYRLDTFPRGDHRAGKAQYWEYLGPNFFSFEYGKIHFMSIDSAYHLGERQLHGREYPTLEVQPMHTAWMKEDMAARGHGTYVVTASETDLVEQCPGFQEMAATYDVRLQLTGDIHVVSEKHHDVPYRTAGALAGCWWNPKCNGLCPDLRPQGYLIYHVKGETMDCFYKGLGQRVAITSHRIGAPFAGNVEVAAHVVQLKRNESLQCSLDGETWVDMNLKEHLFYRAVFATTLDSASLDDGIHLLRIRSTLTGEMREQEVVVANGSVTAALTAGGSLSISTAARTHLEAGPPSGRVQVLVNGQVVGELEAGAAISEVFSIPGSALKKANVVRFQYEKAGDGFRISSPVLTVGTNTFYDVRDAAIREIKKAHWGDEAVGWGGYVVGEGELLETPFVRKQDEFCFVME